MLIDDRIRLYRLPIFRNQFERAAVRASEIFHDDPGAIESALNGWAALNNVDDTILPQIIEMSKVVDFPKGFRFITFEGQGDDVFIILQGNALVKTPNGKLTTRRAVTTLGEKKGIDYHLHRTAHVYAQTNIVALQISGAKFRILRGLCHTFERNIDRDMRERGTEAPLPYKKQTQWYVTLSATSLAIAFGVLAAEHLNNYGLGIVAGFGVFGISLYFMSNFVMRAALTVIAWLFFTIEVNGNISSTEQSFIEFTTSQPSAIAVLCATFIATAMLIAGYFRS